MRIATRLKIISSVTIAFLVVLVPLLLWSLIEFKSAKIDYALADSIKINFFEGASFSDQYFLYHEERARLLWEENKEKSDGLLRQAKIQFLSAEDQQTLEHVRRNLEDSAAIFHRIVDNIKVLNSADGNRHLYEELDKRLYSQLLLKATAIRDNATALKDSSSRHVELTYRNLSIIIGFFAVTLALATILNSIQLSRLIRKRLAPLHDGAKIIADGNLGYRLKISGADEFAELAQSINSMTDKLVQEIRTHTQLENALREAQKIGHIGSYIFYIPEDTWQSSHMMDEILGIGLDYPRTMAGWTQILHPGEREQINSYFREIVAQHQRFDREYRIVRVNDGAERWVLGLGEIEYDANGAPLRMIGIIQDITERKAVENKVNELNRNFVSFLENTSDFIYFKDEKSRIRFCSQTLANITGHASWRDMIGKHDLEIFPKETAQIYHEEELPIFREGKPLLGKIDPYYDASGNRGWVSTSKWPLINSDGKVEGLFGISRDITSSKLAEEKLLMNEARLRAILDNSPYLIWLKDTEGRFIAVNKAFFKTTGLERIQDVLGKTDLDLWPKELAEKYRADDAEVISTRKQKLTEEMSMDNGVVRWVETLKAPIMDKNGNLLGTTGFAQDITGRKNADGQIRHLAHYDPLTDLPNRTLFSDRLQQALTAAKRDKAHLALIFLDLDKFKPINDTLGHHVGDLLLKEAAKRMQDCVRESDTVARIGGDEFVVLLPVIEATQDALLVAEKIRAALNLPFVLVGHSLSISSSAGVAVYPEHGKDETQLVKNADIAMYHAKEGGRNSVKLFQPDMQ